MLCGRKLEQAWEKCEDFNKLQIEKDDLESALKHTLLELDHQKCDLGKVLKERDEMQPKLLEMQASVQEFVSMKMENTSLRSQITSLTERLQARVKPGGICCMVVEHSLHAAWKRYFAK